ncbi:hypothetical protein LCGC14_0383560 [marine sediment metagenome]|uniref:Uncharacterized protein n=1 Tax=marine sediment metagenome TaxID=412755 RepID=A0A0F9TJU7_9ZZZZ
MKIQPVAINHILIYLDNGETLDINDGTLTPSGGTLNMVLPPPTDRFMVVKENNSELIKIEFKRR